MGAVDCFSDQQQTGRSHATDHHTLCCTRCSDRYMLGWGGEVTRDKRNSVQFSSARDGIPGPGLGQEYLTVDS